MIITVKEGFEFRPSSYAIGDKDTESNFFYESYCRALEIIEKYENSLELDEKRNRAKTEACGINKISKVKNIIVIASQRGQGKTSALYSLCDYLGNASRKSVKRLSDSESHYQVKRKYYRLTDIIDPSSLRDNESISRTVLSRLFNEFNCYVKKHDSELDASRITHISELFQKCYENIDIIDGNRKMDNIYDQSSLDNLSAIGDSRRLRENFKDLVDEFLSLVNGNGNDNTLLIPIDDTDLAIGHAFSICEEIRNFFSAENVLVVMAADIDQLENAIEQKYIMQYELMLRNQLEPRDKKVYLAKCREMATRYIEKVFPRGYRVELPRVDDAIKAGEDISLIYKKDADEDVSKLFNGGHYHEQLSKAIYDRTGMVFLHFEDEECPFFPTTLRELNHFVKLLEDMEDVDQDKLFTFNEDDALTCESLNEVAKIRRNIEMLRKYFVWNWLPLHTTERLQSGMESITELPINRLRRGIIDSLEREYNGLDKKDPHDIDNTKRDNLYHERVNSKTTVIEEIKYALNVLNGVDELSGFTDAIRIYYTLALNEWYYQLLLSGNTYKMYEVLVHAFGLGTVAFRKEHNGYVLFDYDCYMENVKRVYPQGTTISKDVLEWMKYYCGIQTDESYDLFKEHPDANLTVWDYSYIKGIRVNIFDCFLSALVLNGMGIETVTHVDTENGLDTTDSNDIPLNSNKQYSIRVGMATIRNMLLNYDIQDKLTEVIKNQIKEFRGKDFGVTAFGYYERISTHMEKWLNDNAGYVPMNLDVLKYVLIKGNTYGGLFFTFNYDNREKLYAEMRGMSRNVVDYYMASLKVANDMEKLRQLSGTWRGKITDIPVSRDIIKNSCGNDEKDRLKVLSDKIDAVEKQINAFFVKISEKENAEEVVLKNERNALIDILEAFLKETDGGSDT